MTRINPLITNLLIICLIWRLNKKRKDLSQSSLRNINSAIYPTMKILFITFTYLVLSVPTSLGLVLHVLPLGFYVGLNSDSMYSTEQAALLLEMIGGYCDCINSSINFIAYCTSGKQFREHFMRLLKMCWIAVKIKATEFELQ